MNDERPIEKLLRRYAKKRRDDAGDLPVLHPATRRLLQGEVARQYPKSAPGKSRNSAATFFALLTKRWIYAVGAFVVLGVTAIVLLPSFKPDNQALLAQKEVEELSTRQSLAPATTPAPATPPAESQSTKLTLADSARNQPVSEPGGGGNFKRSRDESPAFSYSVTNTTTAGSLSRLAEAESNIAVDSFQKTEESKRFALGTDLDSANRTTRSLNAPTPARSAGALTPTDSLSVARPTTVRRDDAADRYNEARQIATPPPAASAPSVASRAVQDKNTLARGGGLEKDTERFYSQSFANVAPDQLRETAAKAKTETPAIAVLTKFQVQQLGNQVRVIDGDGSTYLGEMNTNASGTAGKETAVLAFEVARKPAVPAPAGAATGQQAAQNYFWRVEGTNRTLNQNVVFTWNFVETNNPAISQLGATSGALNQEALNLPSQFPTLLNNSTINGRAQLGPTQQIEVNAVPVRPQ